MKPFNLLVGAAALAALGCSPAALAVPVAVGTSYVFTLTTAQQKAGLPTTSSYATVTLTQAVDKVDVDVRLANGFLFANTGVGPAFTFNLDAGFANAAVNLSGATAQYFYAQGAGSYN